MKRKSKSEVDAQAGVNAFADAIELMCRCDPPDFTKGIQTSAELTEEQYCELQTWILDRDSMTVVTGVGVIEAADVLVRAALECGVIEPKPKVIRCCECGCSVTKPLIYTGYGLKEKGTCSECLPELLRSSIPEHWLHDVEETNFVS